MISPSLKSGRGAAQVSCQAASASRHLSLIALRNLGRRGGGGGRRSFGGSSSRVSRALIQHEKKVEVDTGMERVMGGRRVIPDGQGSRGGGGRGGLLLETCPGGLGRKTRPLGCPGLRRGCRRLVGGTAPTASCRILRRCLSCAFRVILQS